jgi:hypothetical protein
MSHPARIRCGAQPRARSPRPPWPEGTSVLRLAAWSGFKADWDQHLVSRLGVRRVGESCALQCRGYSSPSLDRYGGSVRRPR